MTIGNIKFSQLPDLPLANVTAATIAPVVENSTNYKLSLANISSYVTNGGNITANSVSVSGNITTGNILTNGYYFANGAPFAGLGAQGATGSQGTTGTGVQGV